MNEVTISPSAEETALACGAFLNGIFRKTDRDPLAIAISGGTTPKLLFEILASRFAHSFPWQRIHIFWVDERCVPPTDPESNFGMTKAALLDKISIPRTNIHRIVGENSPENEKERYSEELRSFFSTISGIPSFDLMLLGMGEDGHTASIFPHQLHLLHSEDICSVAEHPLTFQKRITLTGTIINNSKEIIFLVTGKAKAMRVKEILQDPGNNKNLPAAHITSKNGRVHWFIDKEAAQSLNKA